MPLSTTPLTKRFYTDRYLHIRSFTGGALLAILLCAGAYALHDDHFYRFHYQSWEWALIPLGVYAGGVSAVFIHNASHNSFPGKAANWLGGQLAGLHQLWGFTGWKLIHLFHHQYSDAEMDTHPPKGQGFWRFTRGMFLYSSAAVSQRYRAHWGISRKTLVLHKLVLITFSIMAICNLAFWYLLLGPVGFVFFYIPSYIANHLLFAHINHRAHPADDLTGETAPVNLNHNLYFKLANFFWFGIYFHGNHHRKPLLFNPRYMPARQQMPSYKELTA